MFLVFTVYGIDPVPKSNECIWKIIILFYNVAKTVNKMIVSAYLDF